MKKRFGALALVIACLVSIIAAGTGVYFYIISSLGGQDAYFAASKFAAVYSILDNYFVGEADMEEVSDAAYSAMVEAIDDRWSYYMTAEQYESYKELQTNTYEGVGITIRADEESSLLRVSEVTEDSPAHQAGVVAGDLLFELDGESLEGLTSTEVKEMISAKNGEEFVLTLKSEDGSLRDVTLSARTIFSNPIKYELLDSGIGYIKIRNFEGKCAEGAIAALEDLVAQGADKIVFDVRNNPGGLLSELTKLLDYLLPEGDIFISADVNGNEKIITSDADCVDIPMAVLVNANSYSAAEFFAAALSEYDAAVVVGEQTTGKARSQINIPLSDGSAVHLSTNSYLTPNRVDLVETGGLTPDYVVELTEEELLKLSGGELEADKDMQLQKAVSALNGE